MEYTRKEIEQWAARLLPAEWKFRWSSGGELPSSINGMCIYQTQTIIVRPRRTTRSCILDTLAHEVAHVFTSGEGHNLVWWRRYQQELHTIYSK